MMHETTNIKFKIMCCYNMQCCG